MKRYTITALRAKRLKDWKTKTGWGYNAIYNRIKLTGRTPCAYTLLSKWENMAVKSCRADDYKMYIDAYKSLPKELYNVSRGPKLKGYIPVSDEIREAVNYLTSKTLSNKSILSMFSAPKGLSESKLVLIKNGKTDSIKQDHAEWLTLAYQYFKDHQG